LLIDLNKNSLCAHVSDSIVTASLCQSDDKGTGLGAGPERWRLVAATGLPVRLWGPDGSQSVPRPDLSDSLRVWWPLHPAEVCSLYKHFLEARGEDQTDHTNGFACEVGKAVRHATR
jgi:hypothetical protein